MEYMYRDKDLHECIMDVFVQMHNTRKMSDPYSKHTTRAQQHPKIVFECSCNIVTIFKQNSNSPKRDMLLHHTYVVKFSTINKSRYNIMKIVSNTENIVRFECSCSMVTICQQLSNSPKHDMLLRHT